MTRKVLPSVPEVQPAYEVCIIGGGLHGLSLAYHLAKSGRRSVAVFERSYIGAGASGRNLSLIRSSWQQDAWVRLVWYARSLWNTISLELDYNVMFTQRGSFLCIGREETLPTVHAAIAMQNEIGVPTRFVHAAELGARVPQLNTAGIVGAIHDPTAGVSRHDALVWGYANGASRLGVHIHPETTVVGMELTGDRITALKTSRGRVEAEIVVNCAGSGSKEVGTMAGVELPTRPLTLEMFVTEPFAAYLDPIVSIIEDQAYIFQTSRGEFVGGAEPVGHLNQALASTSPALRQSAAALVRLFPRLAGVNMLRAWGGVIDMTPDGAGIVGAVEERPGFFLDCGWGGEGYMVSLATGPLNAAYINSGTLHALLAPFEYKRFERGEPFSDSFLVVDAAGETRA